jgi:hypothetical protein
MKTAIVMLLLLATALAAVPAASAEPAIGKCNGDIDAACLYDDDNDPGTADQLCAVWAPNIATRQCLVGG